jgi:dihydrofolate reductase
MGKLIFSTQMSLDGLIDPMAGGGGWFRPTSENAARGLRQLHDAEAMLLGWTTFEGLAGFWATQQDEWAEALNPMPKYVVSRSPHEQLPWNGSMVEGGIDGVPELKRRLEGGLLSVGCGALAHELCLRGLVDELRFWVHPIVAGEGARPFHGLGQVRLELTDEQRLDHGVVLLSYRPVV